MKATGITRHIDALGRVVLPKELRKTLHITSGTPLEIYVEGSHIILKKYESKCIFCGEAKKLKEYKGKKLCIECISEISNK